MANVNPDRGPPSVAAVAIGTAIISGITGYFLGMGRSIGLFSFLPAAHTDRPAQRRNNGDNDHDQDITDASASSSDEDGIEDGNDPAADRFDSFGTSTEECKLVLVVRTDLGMTKGKIAAQCSHATLACYKAFTRIDLAHPLLKRWEKLGQAKVALKVDSEDEMLMLQAQAISLGLCAQVIHDAGRTQIASGSATVLGIGPAPKSKIDQVTGHLKLL